MVLNSIAYKFIILVYVYFWCIECTKKSVNVKVKVSHYRSGVAQRVGTGIALLFHDRGTRRG
jgi:hypothetical protein